MPVASPGPSNVSTSVATPALLVGIPTGGLRAGDLAYAISTDQYFAFLPASVAAIGASVYYADCALSGLYPGRWVLKIAGANAYAEVPNAAALAGIQTAGLPLGVLVWIDTYRTWARLDSTANAGAVVADEVFASDSANFKWVRMETPYGAWREPLIYCDPTLGNNENPGTQVLPLKDATEFFRRNVEAVLADYELRYSAGAVIPQIVGTMRSASSKWSRVKITGTPTIAASGAVASIASPVLATNTPSKLSGPVADFSPHLQRVMRTLLPSNAYGYSVVGAQAVVGTAETAPWVTSTPNAIGLYTTTGTAAAPIVGATVEIVTMPTITGDIDVTLDGRIALILETLDWSGSAGIVLVNARQFVEIGCRFAALPDQPAAIPCMVLVGGVIPGDASLVFGWQAPSMQAFGTACFRTIALTAMCFSNCLGFSCFGAGFTVGNTSGGFGYAVAARGTNGGGSCIGILVHLPVANANFNPLGDCFVVRSAWLNAAGSTGPLFGSSTVAGSVGIRYFAGALVSFISGYTPTVTGAAKDWDVGSPAAAAVMPPVDAAGAWPAPLAIPGGAGVGWALFNAGTPAGFSRCAQWRGSSMIGGT